MSHWWPHIILIIANLVNVWVDAYKITVLNKPIRHGINFGCYLAVTAICIWKFDLLSWLITPVFLVSAFFNRQITFDIPLNLRRGLKWNYVSLAKPPKALMDRIEVRIFGYNGTAPTVLYFILWIATMVFYFKIKHSP